MPRSQLGSQSSTSSAARRSEGTRPRRPRDRASRGLSGRAPYFHNGSAATLNDVVDFYDTRFTMALTHEEIANMAGTSRETVTRLLNQFRRDQWIAIKGASMTIVQPEELERLTA